MTPITESCGPVMPASVIAAVPPGWTRASLVCTCVCVPKTAGAISTALLLVSLVGIWVAAARGPATPERLVRWSAASLAAFIAFDKVLSPQFLIWLLPLVPLVAGRRGLVASGLLALALLLTQVWFPIRYFDLVHFDEFPSWVLLARDLVLVALVVVLTAPARAPARS